MNQMEQERSLACHKYGLNVMYAKSSASGYTCWTGNRVPLPSFASLEGLQEYAKRNRYGIIYN